MVNHFTCSLWLQSDVFLYSLFKNRQIKTCYLSFCPWIVKISKARVTATLLHGYTQGQFLLTLKYFCAVYDHTGKADLSKG